MDFLSLEIMKSEESKHRVAFFTSIKEYDHSLSKVPFTKGNKSRFSVQMFNSVLRT